MPVRAAEAVGRVSVSRLETKWLLGSEVFLSASSPPQDGTVTESRVEPLLALLTDPGGDGRVPSHLAVPTYI